MAVTLVATLAAHYLWAPQTQKFLCLVFFVLFLLVDFINLSQINVSSFSLWKIFLTSFKNFYFLYLYDPGFIINFFILEFLIFIRSMSFF